MIQFLQANRIANSLFISAGVLILTACSGGGGADTVLGGVAIPSQRVEINSSNVDQVVNESGSAEDKADQAIDTANTSSTVENSTQTQNPISNSLANVKQLNLNALKRKNSISALATNNCPGGGTMTTPDDSNGIGDYIYDQCSFFGTVYDGTISIQGTYDPNGTAFDGSYIYDKFSITGDIFNAIYDGSIYISYNNDGVVTSGHYEIPSLTMVWGKDGVNISGYVVDFEQNQSTNVGYMDFEYTVSSTLLNGSVHAESTQRLYYLLDADYPYEGQVVWSGANGTSARATVLPEGTGLPTDLVLIEVDADGDGDYEESKQVQWQELE